MLLTSKLSDEGGKYRMKAFLSHSSKDKEFVRAVATLLQRQYCIFDERSFDSGIEFKKSIEDGLDESSSFVLFASKNSLASIWVEFELEEAWYQRLRHKLSASIVYLIDSSIEITSLPEWLRRASVRRFNSPQLISRDIRYHLDNLLIERQRPYFTGRSSDINLLEEVLTPLGELKPPRSFLISGLPGIGRRALVKHVIPSLLQFRKFSEIRIGEGDSINDICVNIADITEPYNTAKGLASIVNEIKSISEEAALKRISRNLLSLIKSGELPIIVDDGGFMNEEGYLQEEIKKLIITIQQTNELYVSFISWRKPNIDLPIPFPLIQLRPLGEIETKRLLKLLADHKNVNLLPEQIDELAEYIAGYPPAAYFVIQQSKDYGIELVLRDKPSLIHFTSTIFLRHLSKIGLSDYEKTLLKILASYSPLPINILTNLLEIDPNTLDKMLIRLIDLSLVIATDCGHYRIADPVKEASIQSFGPLLLSEHYKFAKCVSSYLKNAEFEGPQLQLARLLFTAAHISRDNTLAIESIYLVNDLIKLTENLYHQRRYQEVIQTGRLALKERPQSLTARRYLIRGLIQEEQWGVAERQIQELRKYAPTREVFFHQGFLERHRGDIPKAITNYKSAKDLGWRGLAINRELAYCHFRLGEYDPAAEYIKEALKSPVTNRFIVDLNAQIAIRRHNKETAEAALNTLKVIDDPIYYYHRLSTYERAFGTPKAALEAAQTAVKEDNEPPFGVLAQLTNCQIETGHLPEARETLSQINSRFSRIKNDIRQGLKCKLEIACKSFSEALITSKNINDKGSFIYKKLRRDALEGELATSALSDETRKEYESEFAQLDKELVAIQVDEIISLMFDIEY